MSRTLVSLVAAMAILSAPATWGIANAACLPQAWRLYENAGFDTSGQVLTGCVTEDSLGDYRYGQLPWQTWNDLTSSMQVLNLAGVRVRFYRDINWGGLLYTGFANDQWSSLGANNDTISSLVVDFP